MGSKLETKKSLGQNFLKDVKIIERILSVAEIGSGDNVFEVGPGMGALTMELKKRAQKVVAVEIDPRLVDRLKESFEESQGISIIEGNILEVDLNELLEHADFRVGEYKIVANIPYYITAPIIRILLSLRVYPKSLTLMVQREVADRMTAPPGKMSLLSLMVQSAAEARIAFIVPSTAFDPVPAVESAVVQLFPKRGRTEEEERRLFRLARIGFSARRKTLANNLAHGLKQEKSVIEEALVKLGLRRDIRAQALSLTDWKKLTLSLSCFLK